ELVEPIEPGRFMRGYLAPRRCKESLPRRATLTTKRCGDLPEGVEGGVPAALTFENESAIHDPGKQKLVEYASCRLEVGHRAFAMVTDSLTKIDESHVLSPILQPDPNSSIEETVEHSSLGWVTQSSKH